MVTEIAALLSSLEKQVCALSFGWSIAKVTSVISKLG